MEAFELIDFAWPVGVIMPSDSAINPSDYLPFGADTVWEEYTNNFLIGASPSGPLGPDRGSNSRVAAHTHTFNHMHPARMNITDNDGSVAYNVGTYSWTHNHMSSLTHYHTSGMAHSHDITSAEIRGTVGLYNSRYFTSSYISGGKYVPNTTHGYWLSTRSMDISPNVYLSEFDMTEIQPIPATYRESYLGIISTGVWITTTDTSDTEENSVEDANPPYRPVVYWRRTA